MADKKISALTALTTIAAGDLLVTVDVSDTTQAASGTTKKITAGQLLSAPSPIGSVTPSSGEFTTITATGGSITGITDLAIADGGTGASTAAGARTNLGLGSIATQDSSSVAITGGAINGSTIGATTPSTIKVTTLTFNDSTTQTTAGGPAVHTHAGSDIVSGTVNPARLGSGTPASGNFLRGDSSWVTLLGGGDMLGANNLADINSVALSRVNLGLDTMATQAASAVAVTGGTINGTTVGATTASTGAFTTGTFSGTLGVTGVATLGNGAILGTPASGLMTNVTGTASGLTAGNVTTNANLTGDVTSSGNATAIAAGVIVDADINAAAAIADTKLATISTASKVSNSATTAASANTASAIVARDASGNFTAGTITAALTGTASGNLVSGGALGTPSSGTVTNLTGTASININGTVGATTPAAITGTTINGTVITGSSDAVINGIKVGKGLGSISSNTAVGASALNANTSGYNNAAFGYQSLLSNTTGLNNAAFGYASLSSNTSGYDNVAVGPSSLFSNTSGNGNTAVGKSSLYNNTTGGQNTAIGQVACQNNTTGGANTGVGYGALSSNTTGNNNTGVGLYALNVNTTASNNTAVGTTSLYRNTTGASNTAVGYGSLYTLTTGGDNTMLGDGAGFYMTTGASNTGVGGGALRNSTTAGQNVAVGHSALARVSTGGVNTAIGNSAFEFLSTGTGNTSLGQAAGYSATTGLNNTFIGYRSGDAITTGGKNTLLGKYNGNEGGLDIRTLSNYIVLSDGDGTPRLVVNSSGSVGIGTASPQAKFEVRGSSPDVYITRAAASDYAVMRFFTGSSGDWLMGPRGSGSGSDGDFSIYSYGTSGDIMRIARATGNVGIGTTSPSYQLHVNTDSAGKPGVGGLWTVVSDERIKTDIVPADLSRCYDIVKQVGLKHFGFKPGVYSDEQINDKHSLGWIAQDVQKVFGKAVSIKPFTLQTDIPDGTEEYEEQEFTVETVNKVETSIQVINGKPVQVSRVVTSENKVMLFDMVDVLDESGAAVMESYEVTPAIAATDATEEVEAVMSARPVTYQMPRMVTKTRPKVRREVIEDCLDLNGGQMNAALYGAVQCLMAKVEAQAVTIASLQASSL